MDRFNRCFYPYCAQDYIVSSCFQEKDNIAPLQDEEKRRAVLAQRIEALVFLFGIQSLSRTKEPEKYRHKLATGSFGTYYWNELILKHQDKLSSKLLGESRYAALKTFQVKRLDEIFKSTKDAINTNKNQAVFCSKLLHWTFPWVFPMMDKNVLKAIRKEAPKLGIGQVKKTPEKPTAESAYAAVLSFYAGLEERPKWQDGKQLEEYDQSSQPAGLKVPNSWIRIVDKWLWLKGKEN